MTPQSNDPVSALLNAENNRTSAAENLGRDLATLTAAIETYKDTWKNATAAGWAKTDLIRAGFLDPSRLPRTTARTTSRSKTTTDTDE